MYGITSCHVCLQYHTADRSSIIFWTNFKGQGHCTKAKGQEHLKS